MFSKKSAQRCDKSEVITTVQLKIRHKEPIRDTCHLETLRQLSIGLIFLFGSRSQMIYSYRLPQPRLRLLTYCQKCCTTFKMVILMRFFSTGPNQGHRPYAVKRRTFEMIYPSLARQKADSALTIYILRLNYLKCAPLSSFLVVRCGWTNGRPPRHAPPSLASPLVHAGVCGGWGCTQPRRHATPHTCNPHTR